MKKLLITLAAALILSAGAVPAFAGTADAGGADYLGSCVRQGCRIGARACHGGQAEGECVNWANGPCEICTGGVCDGTGRGMGAGQGNGRGSGHGAGHGGCRR